MEQSEGQDPRTVVEGPQKVVEVGDMVKEQGHMLVIEDAGILSAEQPTLFSVQDRVIHNAEFAKGMDEERQSLGQTQDLEELEGRLN